MDVGDVPASSPTWSPSSTRMMGSLCSPKVGTRGCLTPSTQPSRRCWTAPTRSKRYSRLSPTTYPAEQIFAALDHLRTSGYLAEDAAVEARPTMAFWEHAGVPPSLARSRLDLTPVSTVAFGDVDIGSLTELLGRHGVAVGARRRLSRSS